MTEDTEWLRSRATLKLLTSTGLEEWQVLQKLREALALGLVRARVQVAVVAGNTMRDWHAEPLVWFGGVTTSYLSLNSDEYRSEGSENNLGGQVALMGLSFHLGDMQSHFELAQSYNPPAPDKRTDEDLPNYEGGVGEYGRLPAGAKPADRRYEPFAHSAAALVRKGMKLSAAIRQVATPMPPLADSSVEYGIRRTFGLMYLPDGRAIQP